MRPMTVTSTSATTKRLSVSNPAPRSRGFGAPRPGPRSRVQRAPATSGDGGKGDEKKGDDDAPAAEGSGERLTLPIAGADTDWREFRARLVKGASSPSTTGEATSATTSTSTPSRTGPTLSSPSLWAHPLASPEKGCVLVSHPLLFTSTQTYFSRSVVFLIEHDDRPDGNGTAGLILNKPTTLTLSDVGGGVSPLLPEFASSTLHLGGDVERASLHVLHSLASLEGSLEVVSGVRVGGVDAAARAVRDGRAEAGDFTFYHGYCGWAPGQLEREFRSGVWFAAAASSDVVLGALRSLSPSSLPSGSPPMASGEAMWHGVLELMGGEHAEISQALRASAGGGGGGGGGGEESG